MYALLPILMVFIAVIIWIPYFIIKRKDENLKGKKMARIIASIIVLLFLIHPNIVQYMFDAYNCMDIDGNMRVQKDLDVIMTLTAHGTSRHDQPAIETGEQNNLILTIKWVKFYRSTGYRLQDMERGSHLVFRHRPRHSAPRPRLRAPGNVIRPTGPPEAY